MNEKPELRREDYLRHIVEAAERVARYTAGMDRQAFERDEKTKDAVIRNLEIIGEAARRLVEKYPEFTARDTVQTSLPELEKQIRNIRVA